MIGIQELAVLALVGGVGGVVAGMGGPGGIPVIVALNILLALSTPVVAATASSVFVVATLMATALYLYSDGIEWALAAAVGAPAVIGAHAGTRLAPSLSVALFEYVLGGTLLLIAVGIVYRQRMVSHGQSGASGWRAGPKPAIIVAGSLLIGVVAGITGIGGPALTVPFMLLIGVAPIVAIGAGLASGILITVNSALGHALQGNLPALAPVLVVGVPFVLAEVLGWKYVHSVPERTVAYTLAAFATGSVVLIVL
jgi:Sulfite exporter TauE/SafE.